jgi:Rrf2 family transcriptional regulator, iron-sulfur cluster assembly transcription factor
MLSKTSIHAIRALVYISMHGENKYVLIKEMSEKLGISFHFLTKILQILKKRKILHSCQGPNGGVSLSKDPGKIFLIDILRILGDEKIFNQCILGLKKCGTEKPCPVHDDWSKIAERSRKLFFTTTIKNLTDKMKKSDLRISDLKVA